MGEPRGSLPRAGSRRVYRMRAPLSTEQAAHCAGVSRSGAATQPFEILPSLCAKCFRHAGQNFLISNFSDIVRLFLVVV